MPPVLRFPQLSRQRAPKTKETTQDPTLRDQADNGMVATRPRFTRQRRTFDVTIEYISPADKRRLNAFVVNKAVYGANVFLFEDHKDPRYPQQYRVRFAQNKCPVYTETLAEGEVRENCTFSIEEV